MKTIIALFTSLFLFVQFTDAAVLTVSNDPVDNAEYSTLQSAYTAATSGDTLHLQGTNIDYYLTCNQYWDKSLTVIGIGFNPDKQNPKRSRIRRTDCWDQFKIGGNADNTKFYGILFIHQVDLQGTINGIVFEDCYFDRVFFHCYTISNFTFKNCVITRNSDWNLHLGCNSSVPSGLFSNCIFDGYLEGNTNTYANIAFEHCLFLKSDGDQFNNFYYAQISNCIFMNFFPGGTYYADYQNNLSSVAGTFPPDPANGNTASGNIENQDPLFVNYTSGSYYSSIHDYHTQAGSPVENAGNDGTDIGLHGGTSGFSEQGEVLINPIVREVNIQNTTVDPNGTLNVHIKATTPDND